MALLPPFFLDCVLAIGINNGTEFPAWVGTGFLYGARIQLPDATTPKYLVYLVTNRHVRTALRDRQAFVRCNPIEGESWKDYNLLEKAADGSSLWMEHADSAVDVAVIRVDMNKLRDEHMRVNFFQNDDHAAPIAKMRDELGMSEGDPVYVLGFPMGLAAESNTVIARGGNIARIRDLHANRSKTFLIDCQFFPGNSGGPVVSRPEAMAIERTKSQTAAYLLGIAHSYVSYPDTAISAQTGRVRVVFEENSGLAVAHPVDAIEQTIDRDLPLIGATRWNPPAVPPTAP